jgi:opacity protein-like surface antigen
MMFKKILLTAAVLTVTSGVAFANPAPYVGASLGINVNSNNNNVAFGSFRGMPFSVFAGYGGVINQNFYLAGELTGTIATGEISNAGPLKTTYGYGASIIPGVMLSDHTLAFARVGAVRSRFSQLSTMRSGGQVGLGMQTSLTQNVDLRGEYDFTAYKHVNYAGTSTAPRSDMFTVGLVYKFD